MAGYAYPYPPQYPPDGQYMVPDHGDGFTEYYGMGPVTGPVNDAPTKRSYYDDGWKSYYGAGDPGGYWTYYWTWVPPGPCYQDDMYRPSCSKHKSRKHERSTRSNDSDKSRSRSRSQSKSRNKSRSRSRSRTHSRSRTVSPNQELKEYKEPSLLDAFRVMYLTPSKHKKSTTRYLATKKKQDRIQELLKSDGLGSKRWFFYPRNLQTQSEPIQPNEADKEVPGIRDNCDQRVKVDGVFFRKLKKRGKVDLDAPAAKLKRWPTLEFYKRFIVASKTKKSDL